MEEKQANEKSIQKAWQTLESVCSDVSLAKAKSAFETMSGFHVDEQTNLSVILSIPFFHGHINEEFVKKEFSLEILNMLKSLEKLHKIEYNNKEEEAENIRKMFFALTKDLRVIFIKLAYVLAELKHLDNLSLAQQKQKAEVALELFSPLAARLGASALKSQIENLAFRILHPLKCKEIEKQVEEKFQKSAEIIEEIKAYLAGVLDDLEIQGAVMGRKKHTYSIYKKLLAKDTLDQIYDLIALRVLVDDVAQCYAVLGKIHAELTPMPRRFKDYIATPKSNGYQSLHTTILYNGLPVEIQIRTYDMHKEAEYGYTAHWLYKENRNKKDTLDAKLGWIRELMDESQSIPSEEVIETLKVDIYDGEIFVQTPLGKVVHLPEGATPIDFAFAIHSDIGCKMTGAKVNGKMTPITHALANGDVVEITTSQNSKGPSRDWLKVVKTFSARNKIRSFFRREMRDENVKLGKTMLENAIHAAGFTPSLLLTKEYTTRELGKYVMQDEDELFSAIGNNSISPKVVTNHLVSFHKASEKSKQKLASKEERRKKNYDDKAVVVRGADNLLTQLAPCCSPIPNDDIIGYISQGRGIIVHRKECHNVKYYAKERLIDVEWAKNQKQEFETCLCLRARNRAQVLTLVTAALADEKISLYALHVEKLSPIENLIKLSISVKNNQELVKITQKLLLQEGVNEVFRQTNQ